MAEIIELTDWLKTQTDSFDTKKKLFGTTITYKATGEKVIEGFRYFRNDIDELVAAFETGEVTKLAALEYALDDDGDPDTSAVCVLLAYTQSGAFLAAQPQEYRDYAPTLVREPKLLNATPDLASLAFALDQSS